MLIQSYLSSEVCPHPICFYCDKIIFQSEKSQLPINNEDACYVIFKIVLKIQAMNILNKLLVKERYDNKNPVDSNKSTTSRPKKSQTNCGTTFYALSDVQRE
jgi:hypothetical protein